MCRLCGISGASGIRALVGLMILLIPRLSVFALERSSIVYVTEVASVNIDQNLSPAYNFDGWVELYNDGDSSINLGGIEVFMLGKKTKKWIAPSNM